MAGPKQRKKLKRRSAKAIANIVKSRTKPGRTLTKQQKKDLTKRVKEGK